MGFIFLSYGHDRYSRLASQLKEDLNAKGYEVWYDLERLLAGTDWEQYIEDGLEQIVEAQNEGFLLFLMTLHSVRRPDGFCLNELAKACGKGVRNIIPLMVQSGSVPPLSIFRLQNLDVRDCFDTELNLVQENYKRHLARILEILRGRWQLDTEGADAVLQSLLPRIDFQTDWLGYEEFQGREWVFEKIDKWLSSDSPSRVFWIVGGPGVGKTALAIKICSKAEVIAYHFCKAEDSEKKNPANLVKSIAYQLSTQIPEYRKRLLDPNSRLDNTLSEYKDKPRELFKKLVVDSLYGISMEPGAKKVIVIDAVDEANNAYSNDITAFIRDEFKKTPPWLRLILTSRDDPLVNSDLAEYRSGAITIESQDNDNDILHYLEKHLKQIISDEEKANAYAKQIAEKSRGMFLYAVEVMKGIRRGDLKLDELDEFPIGMNAFYKRNYERRFPPNRPEEIQDYKKRVLPLLNTIAAASEPLDQATLKKVLNLSTQMEADILFQNMGTLFIRTDRKLIPVHKSLMDWLVSDAAGIYKIYPLDGHGLLAEYGWKRLKEEEEYGWEEPLDYAIENVGIHLYASSERPEMDATIRERLVELFKKSFTVEVKEKLPEKVITGLLRYVASHHKESEETGFKGIVNPYLKTETEPWTLYRFALFLRYESDYLINHGKADWGRWLLEIQHEVSANLTQSYPNGDDYQYGLAESWNRMGDRRKVTGDVQGAIEAFEKSRTIMKKLTDESSENRDWKRCYIISLGRLGDLGLESGRPRDTLHYYKTILRLLENTNDTDREWKHYQSVCWRRIGDSLTAMDQEERRESYFMLRKRGQIDILEQSRYYVREAADAYRESSRIMRELCSQEPENRLWKMDLSVSLMKEAEMEEAEMEKEFERAKKFVLSQALRKYEQSEEIVKELLKSDEKNTQWQHLHAVILHKIGKAAYTLQDLDRARACLEESNSILLELSKEDNDNAEWGQDLCMSWLVIGELKEAEGREEDANSVFEKAEKGLRSLLERNLNEYFIWKSKEALHLALFKQARILCKQARKHVKLGELQTAEAKYRGALVLIDEMGKDRNTLNPNWVESQKDKINAYIGLGIIELRSGNSKAGSKYVQKAIGTLSKFVINRRTLQTSLDIHFFGTLSESLKEYVKVCIGLLTNEYTSGDFKEIPGFVQNTVETLAIIVNYLRTHSMPQGACLEGNLLEVYSNSLWNMFDDIENSGGSKESAQNSFKEALVQMVRNQYFWKWKKQSEVINCLQRISEVDGTDNPERVIFNYHTILVTINSIRNLDGDLRAILNNALNTLLTYKDQLQKNIPVLIDMAKGWNHLGDFDSCMKSFRFSEELFKQGNNIEFWISMVDSIERVLSLISYKVESWSALDAVDWERIDYAVRCYNSCFSDESPINQENRDRYLKKKSFKRKFSLIYKRVGELEENQLNYEKAIVAYQNSLMFLEEIMKFDRRRSYLRLSIHFGNRLATLYQQIGRDLEAVEWYNNSLERSREFAKQSLFSTNSLRLLSAILINLYELTESEEKRKAYYEEALDIAHRLEQSEIKKRSLGELRESSFLAKTRNELEQGVIEQYTGRVGFSGEVKESKQTEELDSE